MLVEVTPDGGFVAIQRPPRRALAAPAELAQHAPSLREGVVHMAALSDYLGDPLQRPQFGAKAPGAGAAQQSSLQSLPVSSGEPRLASGPRPTPRSPAAPPRRQAR